MMGHLVLLHLAAFFAVCLNDAVFAQTKRDADLPVHHNTDNIGDLGEYKRGHKVPDKQQIDFPGRIISSIRCAGKQVLTYHDPYVACCDPGQQLVASDKAANLNSVWDC